MRHTVLYLYTRVHVSQTGKDDTIGGRTLS